MNEDIRNKIYGQQLINYFITIKIFFVRHHLDSYNDFFENGIRDIY